MNVISDNGFCLARDTSLILVSLREHCARCPPWRQPEDGWSGLEMSRCPVTAGTLVLAAVSGELRPGERGPCFALQGAPPQPDGASPKISGGEAGFPRSTKHKPLRRRRLFF